MVDLLPDLQFAIAMFAVYGFLFTVLVLGMKRKKAIPFILLGAAINIVFMLFAIFQGSYQNAYPSMASLFYIAILGAPLIAILRAVTSKSSRSRP